MRYDQEEDDRNFELNAHFDDKVERYGDRCPDCGTLRWGGDCPKCFTDDFTDDDPNEEYAGEGDAGRGAIQTTGETVVKKES